MNDRTAETRRDEAIIALYEQRDERAITETAKSYGGYCYTVAHSILACHEDAEECVNDTYLHTWNAIPPARPTRLRLFLGRITRNLSLNRYKELHRDKRGGGEVPVALEELDETLADTADISTAYEQAELGRSIDRFLRALPTRDCGIFLRRYYHMEATPAIAKRYGIREANVLLILSRTRQKLRAHLEREGYVP